MPSEPDHAHAAIPRAAFDPSPVAVTTELPLPDAVAFQPYTFAELAVFVGKPVSAANVRPVAVGVFSVRVLSSVAPRHSTASPDAAQSRSEVTSLPVAVPVHVDCA